ncbi:MAG TPA: hypothetical protein VGE74_03440 [Gemmata sp.]
MIGPELTTALLFVAVAGVALLFARDWSVRVAGAFLVLPRMLAAPLTDGEVIIFGCGFVAAASRVVYGWTYAPSDPFEEANDESDPPDADDTSEPAPCAACRAQIPAGESTCPQCGWTYAPSDRNTT